MALRFLKKRFKSSKQPVLPPGDPVRQTTDISAERGGNPEGENCSRWKISQPMRRIGLIRLWGPDADRGGGSGVAKQDKRIGNQQLPAPNVTTPTPRHEEGDTCKCGGGGYQELHLLVFTVTVAPHSAGRGPTIRDPGEQEGGVQQPSETIPEGTIGNNESGMDSVDIGQSRTPRGGFGLLAPLEYSPY